MRVLTLGLALAVLVARPAGAGRMLYATAASDDRIDGFCLRDNGALAPTPSVHVDTTGTQPRRLFAVDDVLYVVELDRVEAYQIGAKGGLSLLGRTHPRPRSSPHDAAIATNGTMLYVPDRSLNRIVGHPLDAEGRPAEGFTTCIQGELAASYQNLVTTPDRLYVSASGGTGRIQVFGIAADGSLFGPNGSPTVSECVPASTKTKRPDATPPLSERRRITDVKSFVVAGDLVYAEDRGRRRIRAFRLDADGNFPPPTMDDPDKPNKKTWPPAVSKTNAVAQYQMILQHNSALLGAQFFHGRIDTYELAPDGTLPRKATRQSHADLRFTPVRLTADQDVVYVAAGEFDRVLAYRLRASGVLAGKDPFSQTEEQKGSFPNDVAVAMLAAGCGS